VRPPPAPHTTAFASLGKVLKERRARRERGRMGSSLVRFLRTNATSFLSRGPTAVAVAVASRRPPALRPPSRRSPRDRPRSFVRSFVRANGARRSSRMDISFPARVSFRFSPPRVGPSGSTRAPLRFIARRATDRLTDRPTD
jgi:hypothetical protein